MQRKDEEMKDVKTLRLISLNTWHGRSLYPLIRFFQKRSQIADIFCLQEIRNSDQSLVDELHPDEYLCGPLFSKIASVLPGFEGSFAAFDDNPDRMSIAMFWRKNISVLEEGDFVVYKPERSVEKGSAVFNQKKLQYVKLLFAKQNFLVANVHGLWNNAPKTDTPDRIKQSKIIKDFLDKFADSRILCGDFNLLPDTESMKILEEGMRNLVKEYGVKSTRTPLYRNFEDPSEPNFADYILVSPEISVQKFEVLPDIVSDHAPLYLEFTA